MPLSKNLSIIQTNVNLGKILINHFTNIQSLVPIQVLLYSLKIF
jgi:hypothetical protein